MGIFNLVFQVVQGSLLVHHGQGSPYLLLILVDLACQELLSLQVDQGYLLNRLCQAVLRDQLVLEGQLDQSHLFALLNRPILVNLHFLDFLFGPEIPLVLKQ